MGATCVLPSVASLTGRAVSPRMEIPLPESYSGVRVGQAMHNGYQVFNAEIQIKNLVSISGRLYVFKLLMRIKVGH